MHSFFLHHSWWHIQEKRNHDHRQTAGPGKKPTVMSTCSFIVEKKKKKKIEFLPLFSESSHALKNSWLRARFSFSCSFNFHVSFSLTLISILTNNSDSEMLSSEKVCSDWILRQEKESFYCLNIHLDLPEGGREHELSEIEVHFGIEIDAG